MSGSLAGPKPAANYCVRVTSSDKAVTGGDNDQIHIMHPSEFGYILDRVQTVANSLFKGMCKTQSGS